MPRRPDVLAATSLSRRAVLCGALAVGLAGCSARGDAGGELGRFPTTVGEDEVAALFVALDAALDAKDWPRFSQLLGSGSDQTLWKRVFDGMHAVPMDERTVEVTPHGIDLDDLRGEGALTIPVAARLRHRIAGVDTVSALQNLGASVSRSRPGGPLLLERLTLAEDVRTEPWQLVDLGCAVGSRAVLQHRVEDAAAAQAALPHIDQGVERAYQQTPQHRAGPKQSILWGWETSAAEQSGRIYGGTPMVGTVGTCFRIPAELASFTCRILMVPQPEPQELEFTACHETVHALAATWGQGLPARHLVEGLATWVEYGFLTGWRRYDVTRAKPHLDEAVATHLWSDGPFYSGDAVGARYAIAALYFCWLEERLGRPAVWDLARSTYETSSDRAVAQALGVKEARELDGAFAAWARAF